jgi:hypothetical protein
MGKTEVGSIVHSFIMTTNWYYINNSDLPGYLTFRKYAIVFTKQGREVSGMDLRNVFSLNCAIEDAKTSYFTLYVPREINLPKLLGQAVIPNLSLKVVIAPNQNRSISFEIDGNEMYADLKGVNAKTILEVLNSSFPIFFLTPGYGLGFIETKKKMKNIGSEEQVTFDHLVEKQLSLNKSEWKELSTGEIAETCK